MKSVLPPRETKMAFSRDRMPTTVFRSHMETPAAVRQARITIATLFNTTGCAGSFQHSVLSDVYEGCGVLRMMGIRNVCFDVTYRLAISEDLKPSALSNERRVKVLAMTSRNGRLLPQGVYSLDAIPSCRLLHFGGRWNAQVAAPRQQPSYASVE